MDEIHIQSQNNRVLAENRGVIVTKKVGFPPKYDPYRLLSVIMKTRDKRTSVIKANFLDTLSEEEKEHYKNASSKWYSRGLEKLEKERLVKRIEKEMDNAYYWVITDEGKKKNEECEKKEK